jgi:hypothetical protein
MTELAQSSLALAVTILVLCSPASAKAGTCAPNSMKEQRGE